jgi:hypothetical protein
MSSAPIVLTSESLSQREARPVVLVSPEEIMRMRTESFAKNKSEIGFLIRQPSAAAIMSSYVELELVLKFKSSTRLKQNLMYLSNGLPQGVQQLNCQMPEGLPLQTKCIRTAVVSINGASQTYRCSEVVNEYLKLHASRDYMEKIGYGWNEHYDWNAKADSTFIKQQDAFRKQLTVNNRLRDDNVAAANGTDGFDSNAYQDNAGDAWTSVMVFREPLVIGIFGALNHMDAYPAWSCESSKSPALLHCDQLQLSFSMHDKWAQNLCLINQNSAGLAAGVSSTSRLLMPTSTPRFTPHRRR